MSILLNKYRRIAIVTILCLLAALTSLYLWDFLQGATPINFYGKVIDQFGEPVPYANINAMVSRYKRLQVPFLLWASGDIYHERFKIKSNKHGLFSISAGMGAALAVGAIDTSEYRFVSQYYSFQKQRLDSHVGSYDYSWYYSSVYGRHRPNSSNPMVYYLWKKGKTPVMLAGKQEWKISRDSIGKPISVDLVLPLMLNQPHDNSDMNRPHPSGPQPTEDWRITFQWEQTNQGASTWPWAFKIEAVNGGFIETEDPILRVAPSEGYQPGFTYDRGHPPPYPRHCYGVLPQGGYLMRRVVYFQMRNGAYGHARIEASFHPTPQILIEYAFNPTGSRDVLWHPVQADEAETRDWRTSLWEGKKPQTWPADAVFPPVWLSKSPAP